MHDQKLAVEGVEVVLTRLKAFDRRIKISRTGPASKELVWRHALV